MAALSSPAVVFFLGSLAFYLIHRLVQRSKHVEPLPPGPKGLPIIGNINDLARPGVLPCHHWLKHKDLYGPISSISVLGQTVVIINDASIALELLRDRSAATSGRPEQMFAGEMIGWKHLLGFVQPDDNHRLQRKSIVKVTSAKATLEVFDRVQEEESVRFLARLVQDPDALFDHIRTEAGAVILRTTYGYTPNAQGRDPLVDMVSKTMEHFGEVSVPGRWTVDVVPWLRFLPDWVPGTDFKRIARVMKTELVRTTEVPYAYVKQQVSEGKHKTSFLSQAFKEIGMNPNLEYAYKFAAASLYVAGGDTTVASLMSFFLGMTLFPEVQVKAQEELNRVVGAGRLPVSADRENLPYFEALVKETHRWHPVAPMALPHKSTQEQVIRGYRIPKGAMLLPNCWWFTHDPSVYPDPMVFNPDRFITTPTHQAEPDPRIYTFGFGRRICPGKYVADNALFLTIAQTLAVFNIEKAVDKNGNTITPEMKFEDAVVSHPLHFRNRIVVRSEKHGDVIRQAVESLPREESDAKELEKVDVEQFV